MSVDLRERAAMLHEEDPELEYAESELHYTKLTSYAAFDELTSRHGLKLTVESPGETFRWKWIAPDGLKLETSRAPFEGEEGYLSYTFVRGPAGAAETFLEDLAESASYMKGEFSPLTTDSGDVIFSAYDHRREQNRESDDTGEEASLNALFGYLDPWQRQAAYDHVSVSIPGSDAGTLRESDYGSLVELPDGATYGSGVNR